MAKSKPFPNQLISEHELKEFIHLAMLIPTEKAFISISEKFPYTSFFQRFVDNAPRQFEDFKIQLRENLTETKNWQAIEVDLKNRFLPELETYIQWHGQNKTLFQKFNPYNPYDVMLLFIQNTRTAILGYFPETFKSFIKSHKEEAFKIDISKENNFAYQRLETQKDKLKNSSFESEVLEVKDLSEGAVKELKEGLQRFLRNEHYKATYKNHTPRYIIEIRLYFEYLDLYNNAIGQSQKSIKTTPDEGAKHPVHDPNLWNAECYSLYKYLYDNYYTGTKRQISNIWFFLKENGNTKYTLKATKDSYKTFVYSNYQIQIKNFDKAQTKYAEKDYPSMDEHRQNFEASLK